MRPFEREPTDEERKDMLSQFQDAHWLGDADRERAARLLDQLLSLGVPHSLLKQAIDWVLEK